MLAKRIIPCLDVKAGRVVKGVNFVNLRDAGDPVQIAKEYDKAGADELVFLDITASNEKRPIMLDVVTEVAQQCFMPFTVGGGIRTIEDVTKLVQAGAEKVSINTAALLNPDIIKQTSNRFGKCATVINIDPKRVDARDFKQRTGKAPEHISKDGKVFEVHTHGGRKPTGVEALPWAKKAVELGAGEIVLTSMDADGTKQGYDIEITKLISEVIDIPLVASGGCGSAEDIVQLFKQTRADAALAASIFHFGEYTINQTKEALKRENIPVHITI